MTRISNDELRIFCNLAVGEDAILDDHQDNLPGTFSWLQRCANFLDKT
jgi:hypothetical protein